MVVRQKYRKMAAMYQHFAGTFSGLDFSDAALAAMHEHESRGEGKPALLNGFAVGKKWMGVTVAMWLEDIPRMLAPAELYQDPALPHWWLDKVLGAAKHKIPGAI